jgi:formamidopyrimidine-DNA glycosylase
MPELPEVETVVRDLRPLLVGRQLLNLELGVALRRPWDEEWTPHVIGRTVEAIQRRGKWIILELNSTGRILVHLGMTGQFTVVEASQPRPDHLHVVFSLDVGRELRFRDTRRFGSVEYYANAQVLDAFLAERLGPEPFEIPIEHFRNALQKTARTLKAILLDQTVVAGVGNIYADEALHRSGLHPESRGRDLTQKQILKLKEMITLVITHAIENRGSTIRDYIGGSGLKGEFQNEFRVYGRTGEPCLACEEPIEMVRVAGRSSHYCPKCQPKQRP